MGVGIMRDSTLKQRDLNASPHSEIIQEREKKEYCILSKVNLETPQKKTGVGVGYGMEK